MNTPYTLKVQKAFLAFLPIVTAALAEEMKDAVPNSDLDNEQPLALTIRVTLGEIRQARNAMSAITRL